VHEQSNREGYKAKSGALIFYGGGIIKSDQNSDVYE
jgi:hypothetical protein